MTVAGLPVSSYAVGSAIAGSLYTHDRSGHAHDGQVVGATPGLAGATGRMFSFDGADDYIIIPELIYTTGHITVECWVENLNTGTERPLITLGDPGGLGGWRLSIDVSNSLNVRDEAFAGFSGSNLLAGMNHLAFTYLSGVGQIQLYLNGQPDGGPLSHSFAGTNTPATIGAFLNTGAFHQGRLSEVAVYDATLSAARILAHYNAGVDAGLYMAAVMADTPIGYWPMNESPPVALPDAFYHRPIVVEVAGISVREQSLVNSLLITDTLGQQVSAQLTLINPLAEPLIGNTIRIFYYAQLIFAGTIDRVESRVNNTLTARLYDCTCVDWAQVLIRRKVIDTWFNLLVSDLVTDLLAGAITGEGLSMGTMDRDILLPLVDSRGGTVFDLLRDVAGVTGQTFYVDFEKRIQFRATSNDAAPLLLDLTTVEDASLVFDRETYRNVQIVNVTGTPASAAAADALTDSKTRENAEQIAARAALEGGTGRYENSEDVVHPTSNDPAEIALLAAGYANLRLATSGAIRSTLNCRVRGWGFRAGQFASLNLATLSVAGTWLIQKVSVHEEDGRALVHDLELSRSSLQQRSYESWLNIVKGGKITVQNPATATSNIQTFTSSGTWTVPGGVTSATFTCRGAGGGGGGYWRINVSFIGHPSACQIGAYGGAGGNGGRAISIVTVVAAQVYTITVGAAGTAGVDGSTSDLASACPGGTASDGGDGGTSSVTRAGTTHCQGNGGTKGTKASGDTYTATPGVNGSPGSGIGDGITVGGGAVGGTANPITVGAAGSVDVEW